MKVAIVGGGPSGLYLSILLKKNAPDWQVSVLEQNFSNDTFGFGVVLADTGLLQLKSADEDSYKNLCASMRHNLSQQIVHRETSIEYSLNVKGGAITRLTLLKILEEEASSLGVDIKFGARIESMDDLQGYHLADADLVVGADGVNSVVRNQFEKQFGTSSRLLSNRFSWYGTRKVFDTPALVFRHYNGGNFVAHYYAYCDDMSTFVAECDSKTWTRLGLDAMSDDQRKELFEEIFAPELDGETLVSNNSVWRQFPVVRNKSWFHDRYVLIGDALASAHFSIGSGTRIAMADAIALSKALLKNSGDISAGLQSYQDTHAATKAKLIQASEKSYTWYESIDEWMARYTPEEFVYQFMTRTGRIDDKRLNREFPDLMQRLARTGSDA